MEKYDLVIRNARIVRPLGDIVDGDIAVTDGIIVHRGPGLPEGDAAKTMDVAGAHVLPGVIDPHTHPGLVAPLESRLPLESRGAAAGGVTTLIQYLRRPENYKDAVPARRRAAEEQMLQDFAFHVTLLGRQHFDDIKMCIEDFGVTSFKIYMNSRMPLSERMRMDALPGQAANDIDAVDYDDGFLLDAFRALEPYDGVRLNIHCENSDIAISETAKVVAAGRTGLAAWNDGRPAIGEAAAIHLAGVMSREFGVPLYIPHVGSREGIRAVDELRRLDTSIVVETCPHYLVLTDESWDAAKVAPPIRKAADQAAVIEALVRGDLNTLGSDEIPYTLDEKNMSTFWSANTAFSGCGLMLPVAITSGLPLPVVAEATSAAPARAFGLDQKGSLDVGKDADLVIVDIDKEVVVRPEDLTSSSDFSVYDGLALRGWPITTISRGEVIFDKGDFPAPHGRGKYLFRSLKTG